MTAAPLLASSPRPLPPLLLVPPVVSPDDDGDKRILATTRSTRLHWRQVHAAPKHPARATIS